MEMLPHTSRQSVAVNLGHSKVGFPKLGAKATARLPELREAGFNDYPQIRRLESEYGRRTRTFDDWQRLWTENPAYTGFTERWPIGWVLEREGRIVGSCSNIPILCEFHGKPLIAAAGRAWVTDVENRGYGILLLDSFVHQKSPAALVLDNTAGPHGAAGMRALGAHPIPAGAWDRSAVWVTDYRLVRDWMTSRGLPLSGLLAPPVRLALLVRDLGWNLLNSRRWPSAEIEWASEFDTGFDEFWTSWKQENRNALLAVRSSEALTWHFGYALREKNLWILTARRNCRLRAYAVFVRRNHASEGSRVIWADFQALCGDERLFYPMLSAALRRCRREQVCVLESMGLQPDGRNIHSISPYSLRQGCWYAWFKSENPELTRLLLKGEAWRPSLFDGDSTL